MPVADYVASLGHRQVAVLAGPDSNHGPRRRRDGLVERLVEHGIAVPPDRCLHTPIGLAESRDATAELLSPSHVPTGVLCVSEVLAMGALAAARDARLSVPDDVSVQHIVGEGSVYEVILKIAGDIDADLILMASHRPELQDYLLGPNASRVVRHATCSVLVHRVIA